MVDGMTERNPDRVIQFKIQPELLHFVAYIMFWFFCAVAILLTKFITSDRLMNPPEEAQGCAPFRGVVNGHDRSGGFDIYTESHLMEKFGFNNICSNWDYSPAREIVALIYPTFEYALLLYVAADWLYSAVSHKKGWVSHRYWSVAKVAYPIMIILCAWFRMIFVFIVYDSVPGHTAGFAGLQVTLMLVALLNVWYICETKTVYSWLGGERGTKACAYAYLVSNLAISFVKFFLSIQVVMGHPYPIWATTHVTETVVVGQIVDRIWMFFNAILPLIISLKRSRTDHPLEFTLDLNPPTFVMQQLETEEGEEA